MPTNSSEPLIERFYDMSSDLSSLQSIQEEPKARRTPGIMDAIYGRRSVRDFTSDVPSADSLHTLLYAATQAPMSHKEKRPGFIIVQDRNLLDALSDMARQAHNADDYVSVFHNAGTLIILCSPANVISAPEVWLAAQNIMLAATAMGFGTCLAGKSIPVMDTPPARALLAMEADVKPVAAIVIGKPATEGRAPLRDPPNILNWL
jgi:nitroreductase